MKNFMSAVLLATLAVAAAQAQATGGNAEARKLKNPVAATPASVSAGAATYKKYCAYCHGEDAKGEGQLAPKNSHPPDLTDAESSHGSSDGEIFTVIQAGPVPSDPKAVMKAFKGKITDQDLWNVVNHLQTLRAGGTR